MKKKKKNNSHQHLPFVYRIDGKGYYFACVLCGDDVGYIRSNGKEIMSVSEWKRKFSSIT